MIRLVQFADLKSIYAYFGASGRPFRKHPDSKPVVSGHLAVDLMLL